MLFVPITPTPSQQPLSPRTRELSELLGRVIEEYEKHHPSVSASEVRMALRMAGRSSKAEGAMAARLTIAALIGLLALGGVAFFLMGEGRASSEAMPSVLVAVAVFGLLAAVVAARHLRS